MNTVINRRQALVAATEAWLADEDDQAEVEFWRTQVDCAKAGMSWDEIDEIIQQVEGAEVLSQLRPLKVRGYND